MYFNNWNFKKIQNFYKIFQIKIQKFEEITNFFLEKILSPEKIPFSVSNIMFFINYKIWIFAIFDYIFRKKSSFIFCLTEHPSTKHDCRYYTQYEVHFRNFLWLFWFVCLNKFVKFVVCGIFLYRSKLSTFLRPKFDTRNSNVWRNLRFWSKFIRKLFSKALTKNFRFLELNLIQKTL